MSLLDEYARTCTILTQERVAGPEGGWTTEWVEGETFINHSARSSSAEVDRAEKLGEKAQFTILIDQAVPIAYGDYYRDEQTGETYRVTSDPEDLQTPPSSTLCLKACFVERRDLPE
ncbi:MAG: hypothetical protein LUC17_00020 [Oscillospiraceae bacterium]|nr:hypothetical protein [Oscillospiraceae bacterium]